MPRTGGARSLLVASAIMAWCAAARAQPATDPAAAQSLFDEAKRLMQEKNFAAACPKFAESQRLDPAGGTILALALCHEAEGKTATAWAEFTQAASDARRDKRSDRETAAAEHARALEARLARVRIQVAKPVADGMEIKRDGLVVGSAQWSSPVAVDPGPHVFEASAPGRTKWSSTVTIQEEGKVTDVVIPSLGAASGAVVTTPPGAHDRDNKEKPKDVDVAPRSEAGSSQRTWGLVVGGVGIVAAGVGAGFGLSASSKWKDAEKACPGNVCPSSTDAQKGKDAGSAADVSTALFVVGGIGLVAGAVLFFTAPKGDEAKLRVTPWAGPGGAGATVGGVL